MTRKYMYAVLCVLFALASSSRAFAGGQGQPASKSPRVVLLLDKGWMFRAMPDFQMWPPQAQLTASQIAQLHCPWPGKGWQTVDLPDDYVVKGDISQSPNASLLAGGGDCALGGRECGPAVVASAAASTPAANNKPNPRSRRSAYGGHGYLPLYPAWYRRVVFIPESARGKNVWLDFEGVYRDAIVFVNGTFIAQHASGYTAFRQNITSALRYGENNSVSVFVDPRWFEGWWYEGGGIYRHVRLMITDKLQVAPWGTFVVAKVPGPIRYDSRAGDQAAADLTLETTVRNDYQSDRSFTLESQVINPAGETIASTSSSETLAAGQEAPFQQHVALQDTLLWSLEHPSLYRLTTSIRVGDSTVDEKQTTFGIRTTQFDPARGFFLNGRRLEIRGICSHQDFPGVGVAAPDNLWEWRIGKLKAMGANAYRCAHNPVAEAFYGACDRMGMLVMDENRHLGDTQYPKADEGTPYSDLSELQAMVLQHRNHPSIIFWSLCNEEGLHRTSHGAKMFAAMKASVQKIDPTRSVTSAMNGGYTKEGFLSVEDLMGMNYHNQEFAKMHSEFPGLMIFGSEDINSKSSRGTLETIPATGLCSAYGCGSAPEETSPEGGQPWHSWMPVVENPFVAGEFVWTGFDYRGEPNPFSWPAVTSQVGVMDLCGFPKEAYYYWKTWWQPEPSVYVFPNWDLPASMIGRSVVVRSYANCQRVELQLNGKSLGSQPMARYGYADWHVPYAPGELTALGYDHGQVVARYTTETPGPPAALQLTAEVQRLAANGEAVAPIQVAVVDAHGRVLPGADPLIRFSVSGAGTLAGVANGNPASHEANVANERKAFRGLCMVVVRAGNHRGAITVTAQARGLVPAHLVIHTTRDAK